MTASSEQKPITKSNSRRALLAGALGGIGAAFAGAVAKVSPVRAEGETMVVGGEYTTATSRTYLANSTNANGVFMAISYAGGIGIYGGSNSSAGIYGVSTSSVGVVGQSTSSVGVQGYSSAADRPAVLGQTSGNHTGLQGYSGGNPVPDAKPKTGTRREAQDRGLRLRGAGRQQPRGVGLRRQGLRRRGPGHQWRGPLRSGMG